MLKDEDRHLKKVKYTGKQPLPNRYLKELEQSDDMIPELVSRSLQLIGILNWEVELGRIEIFMVVGVMSQYSASPRLVHLESFYHMF